MPRGVCIKCGAEMYQVIKPFDKYQEGDCFCWRCSGLLVELFVNPMPFIKD
jgi:hypothetical protein